MKSRNPYSRSDRLAAMSEPITWNAPEDGKKQNGLEITKHCANYEKQHKLQGEEII